MATTTAPPAQPQYPLPYRFSVAEFEAILDTPPFVERPQEGSFELIDGRIYREPPMNDPQWLALRALTARFARAVPDRLLVRLPVVISDFDEPSPDLAIVRADFPYRAKPRGQDLSLVIEVSRRAAASPSDRTRREYDLHTKLPRYQAGGVAEVWIVDLVEQVLLVWRGQERVPAARHPRGQQAQGAAQAVPECVVDVDAPFGAAEAGGA